MIRAVHMLRFVLKTNKWRIIFLNNFYRCVHSNSWQSAGESEREPGGTSFFSLCVRVWDTSTCLFHVACNGFYLHVIVCSCGIYKVYIVCCASLCIALSLTLALNLYVFSVCSWWRICWMRCPRCSLTRGRRTAPWGRRYKRRINSWHPPGAACLCSRRSYPPSEWDCCSHERTPIRGPVPRYMHKELEEPGYAISAKLPLLHVIHCTYNTELLKSKVLISQKVLI